MPVPLQYQSQFIPTNYGAVENVLRMYRQDMGQREQQFDLAQQMQDQAVANIYGMETLDPDVLQQAGDALSQRIDDIVSKRGGDYGAAAKDISSLIAQESRNPIYGLNKRKLEQTKLLEQALARNPNLLALQDPRKMSLTQKGLTPEDISYSVADPATIQEAIKDIYGERGNQVRQTGLRPSGTKGYLMSEITKGLTDSEIEQLSQDPATLETLLARVPQLQGYMDNPEIANWFTTQVQQGLMELKGGSQKQFVRDHTMGTDSGKTVPTWLAGVPMPQVGIDDVRLEKTDKPLMKEAENLTKLSKDLNKPKDKITITPEQFNNIMTKYSISQEDFDRFSEKYPSLTKTKALSSLIAMRRRVSEPLLSKVDDVAYEGESLKQGIEEAKQKYSNYYTEGMSDEEFLNTVSKELTSRAKKTDKLFSMNVEGYDALARLNLRSDEQFTKKGSNKQYSLNDIYTDYKDKGTTELYSSSSPMFDDNLNIVVQGADNELYEMKPSTDIHKYYADKLKAFKGILNDNSLTEEEQQEFRNLNIPLPGVNVQVSFDFVKPSGKSLEKLVNLTYLDNTTETGVTTVQMRLKDFVDVVYKNMAQNAIFAQQLTPNK